MATAEELERLVALVERLRRDCPWDREQTPETIRTFLLEECYETLEAIDAADASRLREELGDLLFQIFFLATLARERGWFSLADVASGIAAKMVDRHPHVFGGAAAASAAEVQRGWEARKRRGAAAVADPFESLPVSLPSLSSALRMTSRAADLGFDWERDSDVASKIEEELGEWREASANGDARSEEKEIGDLLLSAVNLARRRGIDPEAALRQANTRFRARFARVCQKVRDAGTELGQVPLEQLDRYWEQAKDELSADSSQLSAGEEKRRS